MRTLLPLTVISRLFPAKPSASIMSTATASTRCLLVVNSGNWQPVIQYRVDQLSAHYNTCSLGGFALRAGMRGREFPPDFLSPDSREQINFTSMGGPTYWYTFFNRFVADGASTNVLLGTHDYGMEEKPSVGSSSQLISQTEQRSRLPKAAGGLWTK